MSIKFLALWLLALALFILGGAATAAGFLHASPPLSMAGGALCVAAPLAGLRWDRLIS